MSFPPARPSANPQIGSQCAEIFDLPDPRNRLADGALRHFTGSSAEPISPLIRLSGLPDATCTVDCKLAKTEQRTLKTHNVAFGGRFSPRRF
jgi:hypothetical protein